MAQKPDVDYRQLSSQPSPEEFFLLSRVTGVVSVAELCSVSGLGRDKTLAVLERLFEVGLLDVVDSDGTPVAGQAASARDQASGAERDGSSRPGAPSTSSVSEDSSPSASSSTSRRVPRPLDAEPLGRQGTGAKRGSKSDDFSELGTGSAISEPSEGSIFGGDGAISAVVDEDDDDLFMPSSPVHRARVDGRFTDNVDMAAFAADTPPGTPASTGSVGDPARPTAAEPASERTSKPTSEPTSERTSKPVSRPEADDGPSAGADEEQEAGFARFPRDFDSYEVPEGERVAEFDLELQREIHFVHDQLDDIDFYQLFGVEQDAGRREIRKAYFTMSKRFHPDKFFRAEATELAAKVESIFKFVTKGYQTLSKKSKREEYDVALKRRRLEAEKETAEQDRKRSMAAEMLERRAGQLEEKGDLVGASEELRKVATLRREPKVLLKAANLLVRANRGLDQAAQLARVAAQKLPEDVEPRLVLGRIYEKNDMLKEAVEVLEEAVALAPEDPSVRVHLERVRSRL